MTSIHVIIIFNLCRFKKWLDILLHVNIYNWLLLVYIVCNLFSPLNEIIFIEWYRCLLICGVFINKEIVWNVLSNVDAHYYDILLMGYFYKQNVLLWNL